MKLHLTFDLDLTDYQTGKYVDEPGLHLKPIMEILGELMIQRTTWFVRIDKGVETLYGGQAALRREIERISEIVQGFGHKVGWHHHSSARAWDREQDLETEVLEFGELAQSLGLTVCRSGFGQMTERIMLSLSKLGFGVDSSCISRPNYPWENIPHRNWTGAPNHPYTPCRHAKNRECSEESPWICEVPITTVFLPLPTDTQEGVRRYLNPAYQAALFQRGLESFVQSSDHNDVLVTVSHPYETQTKASATFSGNLDTLGDNIKRLLEVGFVHTSISELR